MVATYGAFGDLLDARFQKIFSGRQAKYETMIPQLFREITHKGPDYRTSSTTGFGSIVPFTGAVRYGDIYQGYNVTIDFVEYAPGFKIQRKLWDDAAVVGFGAMDAAPSKLGQAMKNKREEVAADIFINSFSSADGGDSLSLCNSAHTSEAGAANQSNTGTTGISATQIATVRIAGRKIKDPQGKFLGVNYNLIVCPVDVEEIAYEVINSKGKVETANNNVNYHYGRYDLSSWILLTNTADWWMADKSLMNAGADAMLLFVNRIPIEFNKDKDFESYISKWSAYERYGAGYNDWRFIYGNNV